MLLLFICTMPPQRHLLAVRESHRAGVFLQAGKRALFAHPALQRRTRSSGRLHTAQRPAAGAGARQYRPRLSTNRRQISAAPVTPSLSRSFDAFPCPRAHTVQFVDEYGSVRVILPREDILATLLRLARVDEADARTDTQTLARGLRRERADAMTITIDDQTLEQGARAAQAQPGEAAGGWRRIRRPDARSAVCCRTDTGNNLK